MSVIASMVRLRPRRRAGCRAISSGRSVDREAMCRAREGPHEAGMTRRCGGLCSPCMICHSPTVSGSRESSFPLCSSAVDRKMGPANARVSVLPRATVFAARRAASVGSRPTRPALATMTRSTSGWVTISFSVTLRTPSKPSASAGQRPRAKDAMKGRKARTWSTKTLRLAPAPRPTTRTFSGKARATLRTASPSAPVEPRTAIRRGLSLMRRPLLITF